MSKKRKHTVSHPEYLKLLAAFQEAKANYESAKIIKREARVRRDAEPKDGDKVEAAILKNEFKKARKGKKIEKQSLKVARKNLKDVRVRKSEMMSDEVMPEVAAVQAPAEKVSIPVEGKADSKKRNKNTDKASHKGHSKEKKGKSQPVEIEVVAGSNDALPDTAPSVDMDHGKKGSPQIQVVTAQVDDLKLIEGIGPKIETVLRDAGISSFKDLAAATSDHLKEILITANKRYSIHNPTTWAQQAQLAADGKMDQLLQWQEELKGGRVK